MPNPLLLYRKRLIPAECILLKNDKILWQEENFLITQWKTIRPKKELDHGCSCYLLGEGWKVSKFLNAQGKLLCWYCDIIDTEYDASRNAYTFVDLLADVLVYPDGRIHVVDLDEVADALEERLITIEQMKSCMRKLNSLLKKIYAGDLFEMAPVRKMMELDK